MINERFAELSRRPDAPFLGAGAGGGSLSRTVDSFSFTANVQDSKIQDGLSALVVEANRVRQYGFAASELDRVKSSTIGVHGAGVQRAEQERERLVCAGVHQLLPGGRAVAGHRVPVPPRAATPADHHRRRGVHARADVARRRQPRASRRVAAESGRARAVRNGPAGDAHRSRRRRRDGLGRHDAEPRPDGEQACARPRSRRGGNCPRSASPSSDSPTASKRS